MTKKIERMTGSRTKKLYEAGSDSGFIAVQFGWWERQNRQNLDDIGKLPCGCQDLSAALRARGETMKST